MLSPMIIYHTIHTVNCVFVDLYQPVKMTILFCHINVLFIVVQHLPYFTLQMHTTFNVLKFYIFVSSSVDPDQLASEEAS